MSGEISGKSGKRGDNMAWHAELKRKQWYCINGIDIIHWYRKRLYDDWYASLTSEERQELQRRKEEKKEREKQETERALQNLLCIAGACADVLQRRM